MSNIKCENLATIRIMNIYNVLLKRQLSEILLRFCQRSQNLRRMEVIKNIGRNCGLAEFFNSKDEALIGWFNQLRATTIDSFNVMVINAEEDPITLINWRVAGVDEIELFGRCLTEDENRFFI